MVRGYPTLSAALAPLHPHTRVGGAVNHVLQGRSALVRHLSANKQTLRSLAVLQLPQLPIGTSPCCRR